VKHLLAIIVAVGLVVSFLPAKTVRPTPAGPASKVCLALRSATKEDRARVSSFYDALADVVSRSQSITTVEGFRRVHASSLDEAFKGTDLPGKYPGLDVAIDEELVAAVGRDNTGLDGEQRKRAALVKALQKVAADAR
jgi:hypothetical protein